MRATAPIPSANDSGFALDFSTFSSARSASRRRLRSTSIHLSRKNTNVDFCSRRKRISSAVTSSPSIFILRRTGGADFPSDASPTSAAAVTRDSSGTPSTEYPASRRSRAPRSTKSSASLFDSCTTRREPSAERLRARSAPHTYAACPSARYRRLPTGRPQETSTASASARNTKRVSPRERTSSSAPPCHSDSSAANAPHSASSQRTSPVRLLRAIAHAS